MPSTRDSKPIFILPWGGIAGLATSFYLNLNNGVAVAPGETVTWEATAPTAEPATAAVICVPENSKNVLDNLETKVGIDKQIIADQINAKLPAGSSGLVTADSISAGSLQALRSTVGLLGSSSGSSDSFGSSGSSTTEESGGNEAAGNEARNSQTDEAPAAPNN